MPLAPRGGRTTKLHALSYDDCRPVAFAITPSNAHDLAGAWALLAIAASVTSYWPTAPMTPQPARLAERAGTEPIVRPDLTHQNPHTYRDTHRGRNLIERMFFRLKDFRRIANFCDVRADIFISAVCLIAALAWWAN